MSLALPRVGEAIQFLCSMQSFVRFGESKAEDHGQRFRFPKSGNK
jgi:hypothetical protein